MKKLLLISTFCVWTAAAPVWAQNADSTLPVDSRIKWLTYDESDVYTITTRYGYQTNIVFARGEEVQTISVGDRSLWQIIPSGNRLFIRPMEENVTTNMTVITNRHAYQFDLKSIGEKGGGNIYVAQFVYPNDQARLHPVMASTMMAPPPSPPSPPLPPVPPPPAPGTSMAAPLPAPVSETAPVTLTASNEPLPPVAPSELNYNYTYSGPDNLAPLQVYDNGKTTFIKYRTTKHLPDVFIVGNDGKETPAVFYKKDDLIAIDQVAGEMVLKSKSGSVHVYNEVINPPK